MGYLWILWELHPVLEPGSPGSTEDTEWYLDTVMEGVGHKYLMVLRLLLPRPEVAIAYEVVPV